jgi:hypothetical protein
MKGRVLATTLAIAAFAVAETNAASAETARDGRRSRLLTLGGSYSLEVGGCGRNNRSFRVSSPRPIDTTRVQPGQVVSGVFIRPRERAGRAGWRNVTVSADGLSVEFELFAEGSGSAQTIPGKGRRCVHESPGGIVVDVSAWVLEPPQNAGK